MVRLVQTDAENVDISLETSSYRNLAFYKRCAIHPIASFEVDHHKFGALPRHYLLATESKIANEQTVVTSMGA